MSLLTFANVSQSFGANDIFMSLGGSIAHGAKVGLVGPNGIGKTTLLRILAGRERPSAGHVHLAKGTTLGYLRQEAMLAFADQSNTVYDEMRTVFAGLEQQAAQLRQMEQAMSAGDFAATLLDEYGRLQQAFETAGGYDYDLRIQQTLTGLGFGAEQWPMPLAHCSGGQKTRALLARLLLEHPDLLILDEPTNHLDVAAIEWLEGQLRVWSGAALIVSHDRYFLDKVVGEIWEMSRNGLESYRGAYTAYLGQREERWALRDEEFRTVQENFLKELDFIKRNIARASSTDKARGRFRRLVRQVKAVEVGGTAALNQDWSQFMDAQGISGEQWNMMELEGRIKALPNPNPRHQQVNMRLLTAQRSGRLALRTSRLQIGYPGNTLFHVPDLELHRLERVAFIGPNGTGKTTLLRTLLGEIAPVNGRFHLGAGVQISYFSQAHEQLNLERTVLDELLSYRNLPISEARNYLARYLFRGEDVFKQVGMLSGGERGRLALAILALDHANFLLLDEPTNHLDLPAQEVLQAALAAFTGTALLVTHDRYLVDRLATQIWWLDGAGHFHVHKGDYQSFLAWQAGQREPVASSKDRVKNGDGRRQREAATAVAATEQQISAVEKELNDLNAALEAAAQSQQWAKVQTLSQAYNTTQTQLEILMYEWETLALV